MRSPHSGGHGFLGGTHMSNLRVESGSNAIVSFRRSWVSWGGGGGGLGSHLAGAVEGGARRGDNDACIYFKRQAAPRYNVIQMVMGLWRRGAWSPLGAGLSSQFASGRPPHESAKLLFHV